MFITLQLHKPLNAYVTQSFDLYMRSITNSITEGWYDHLLIYIEYITLSECYDMTYVL